MTKLRQLWLLTALGTLAVLAGGYFLLISPQSDKAAALREETDTQLATNRQIKTQIDMLNKQKKDLPAQQAKLARFAGLIPPNPALPALTRNLSDAADNSGVEVVAMNPTLPTWAKGQDLKTRVEIPGRVPAPNGAVLVNIPVEVHVLGSYTQLTQFFTEIEELNRALLVQGFKVEIAGETRKSAGSNAQADEDPDMLRAELKIQVMMTKKPAVSAAPTGTSTTTSTSTAAK